MGLRFVTAQTQSKRVFTDFYGLSSMPLSLSLIVSCFGPPYRLWRRFNTDPWEKPDGIPGSGLIDETK